LAKVKYGATVAVFGDGPVGILAACSSLFQGASLVCVVDYKSTRPDKAKSIGAMHVDFTKGDPVEQIIKMIVSNPGITGSKLPGEEKMDGVMNDIDVVGYQARDRKDHSKENPTRS
jgi:threonine dehydrogenase-like Zn-dependent dehydrogenase